MIGRPWVFHGRRDTKIPMANVRPIIQIRAPMAAPVRYTELPNADHGIADVAYERSGLVPRLVAQHR